MAWTRICDLHSGGGKKGQYDYVLIEAPLQAARLIYNDLFPSIDLDHESCDTCGKDYSVEDLNESEYNYALSHIKLWVKPNESFIYTKEQMNEAQLGLIKYFESRK